MSIYHPFDTRHRQSSSELSHWQYQHPNISHYHQLERPDYIPSSYLHYYQEPSQRSYIPSASYSPSLSCTSNRSSVDNWADTLYSIQDDDDDDDDEEDDEPPYVSPPQPAIKAEPEENFIIELRTQSRQLDTPSNNVPLRATHACDEMLAMMGVFRLDPFVVRGAAWKPEANTGLDRSPVMIEFTLELPEEIAYEQESNAWPLEDDDGGIEYSMSRSPQLDYPESESYSGCRSI